MIYLLMMWWVVQIMLLKSRFGQRLSPRSSQGAAPQLDNADSFQKLVTEAINCFVDLGHTISPGGTPAILQKKLTSCKMHKLHFCSRAVSKYPPVPAI